MKYRLLVVGKSTNHTSVQCQDSPEGGRSLSVNDIQVLVFVLISVPSDSFSSEGFI